MGPSGAASSRNCTLTRPTKQVLIAISWPFWRIRTWNPQSMGGPSVSEVRTG
jgi:hypothetical protein